MLINRIVTVWFIIAHKIWNVRKYGLNRSVLNAGRRSGMEIVAEILVEAKRGVSKTRLVYRTNLNFLVIRKHLDFLLEKDLLEIVNPNELYMTTAKGCQFLEEFEKLKEILGQSEIEPRQICSIM
jgi:predicted transcriptional regulator